MNKIDKNRGFIKTVIIIVGALIAIKYYYHFDVVAFLTTGRVGEITLGIYDKILSWFGK